MKRPRTGEQIRDANRKIATTAALKRELAQRRLALPKRRGMK